MLNERTDDDDKVTRQLLRETGAALSSVGPSLVRSADEDYGMGIKLPAEVRERLAGLLLRIARALNPAILSLD